MNCLKERYDVHSTVYIFYIILLVIFIPAPFHCSPTHAILLIRFFRIFVSFFLFLFMLFYLIFMQRNLPTTVMFLANCYYPSNYAINIISQSTLEKEYNWRVRRKILEIHGKKNTFPFHMYIEFMNRKYYQWKMRVCV